MSKALIKRDKNTPASLLSPGSGHGKVEQLRLGGYAVGEFQLIAFGSAAFGQELEVVHLCHRTTVYARHHNVAVCSIESIFVFFEDHSCWQAGGSELPSRRQIVERGWKNRRRR